MKNTEIKDLRFEDVHAFTMLMLRKGWATFQHANHIQKDLTDAITHEKDIEAFRKESLGDDS